MSDQDSWSIPTASATYGCEDWGHNYFEIDTKGQVCVCLPGKNGETSTLTGPSLLEIISRAKQKSDEAIRTPILLRFPHLVVDRVEKLNKSFASAMRDHNYPEDKPYRAVYPVKVNQQRMMVQTILEAGAGYHHGLEVGSKAELTLALSMLKDRDAFLICNGRKDREYIELAFAGLRAGLQVFLVIESPAEISKIAAYVRETGLRPRLGARVRLRTPSLGDGMKTGQTPSFFGMDARELMIAVQQLKKEQLLDRLELLHYHQNSQIPTLKPIRDSVREACRFYVGLCRAGAPMGVIDIGGGLAIDYDASHSPDQASKDYEMEDYANTVVGEIAAILGGTEYDPPIITSESGRAVVAAGETLVFSVLESEPVAAETPEPSLISKASQVAGLIGLHDLITVNELSYTIVEATELIAQVRTDFSTGIIEFPDLSQAEAWYGEIVREAVRLADLSSGPAPPEIEKVRHLAADFYFASFSIFQSMPDLWGIDQVFPMMPIHRLLEEPTRNGTFVDLTCDHDGSVDKFGSGGPEPGRTLRLHELDQGEDYYVAAFLLGAYQEVLGDRHNLFGETHVANVHFDADGRWDVAVDSGEGAAQVLDFAGYKSKQLTDGFAELIKSCPEFPEASNLPSPTEIFAKSLSAYPYLTD